MLREIAFVDAGIITAWAFILFFARVNPFVRFHVAFFAELLTAETTSKVFPLFVDSSLMSKQPSAVEESHRTRLANVVSTALRGNDVILLGIQMIINRSEKAGHGCLSSTCAYAEISRVYLVDSLFMLSKITLIGTSVGAMRTLKSKCKPRQSNGVTCKSIQVFMFMSKCALIAHESYLKFLFLCMSLPHVALQDALQSKL